MIASPVATAAPPGVPTSLVPSAVDTFPRAGLAPPVPASARRPLRVVVCHNYYQQPGGEDEVFAAEMALLTAMGDQVVRFTRDNRLVRDMDTAGVAVRAVWSRESCRALGELVRRERPDVVHFHNTFPLISPAAYYAVRAEGAAVVQTLHNYRILCPSATLYRDGHVCEDCVGKAVPWPSVLHHCYRDNRRATAAVAVMLTVHGIVKTYDRAVDRYIALTDFSREKFIAGGLPAGRIAVKPNFVFPDPGPGRGDGGYALYVGRLAHEKGIDTMLKAWAKRPGMRLRIVGDGPLAPAVAAAAAASGGAIEWLGRRPLSEVYEILGAAACMIFPSVWYEGFPRSITESMAKGTPIIASDLGSMRELVVEGVCGLRFPPGDAGALAERVARLVGDPALAASLRNGARAEFEAKYTPERNYETLRGIYEAAAAERRADRTQARPIPAGDLRGIAGETDEAAPRRVGRARGARAATKFKVLLAHNYYRHPGGEDNVFADETRLLDDNGHEVLHFNRDNKLVDEIDSAGMALGAVWSRESYQALAELVRRERPDVVHFHNTFPLMSPSVYFAARREGAAVVQTLHNYRLICPSAVLFRDGHVCEECVGKPAPWPGVMHGCYRGSRPATAAVAAMLTVHGAAHTYDRAVDRYIALTEFSRQKFIAGGLPGARIAVKPNFVAPDPGPGPGDGRYALYVGTLVPGKGVETMLRAWDVVGRDLPLKIVGDGELAGRVREAVATNPAVEWLGRRPLPEVYRLMGRATCLVFPSLWYENMPKTIVEAYAKGTPVVASKIGAMVDLIDHGRTGLHFAPGDPQDLAAQVKRLVTERGEYARCREQARRAYEAEFTPQANYAVLSRIYDEAVAMRRGSAGA